MNLSFKLPDCFVPEEKEFQVYCAIKLYKGKYITKEEAVKMCGYNINESDTKKFEQLYAMFEKRYKKICGYGYADGDFKNDPK